MNTALQEQPCLAFPSRSVTSCPSQHSHPPGAQRQGSPPLSGLNVVSTCPCDPPAQGADKALQVLLWVLHDAGSCSDTFVPNSLPPPLTLLKRGHANFPSKQEK